MSGRRIRAITRAVAWLMVMAMFLEAPLAGIVQARQQISIGGVDARTSKVGAYPQQGYGKTMPRGGYPASAQTPYGTRYRDGRYYAQQQAMARRRMQAMKGAAQTFAPSAMATYGANMNVIVIHNLKEAIALVRKLQMENDRLRRENLALRRMMRERAIMEAMARRDEMYRRNMEEIQRRHEEELRVMKEKSRRENQQMMMMMMPMMMMPMMMMASSDRR